MYMQPMGEVIDVRKVMLPERPEWRAQAAELGFTFADMHGEPYWDETSAYQFSLQQIEEDLEGPATELHGMCREAVAEILAREELMAKMGIPREHWDLLAESWQRGDPEIYGRFDLAYDGTGPAKLLEYNADTPTSLYESASFQWSWLEGQLEAGVLQPGDDQFNGIHEALVERFRALFAPGTDLHFAAAAGNPEDYATVECMGWAAREADLGAHYTDLDKIAISDAGQFLDAEDRVIGLLFKLYPWEDLLRDEYAQHLRSAGCMMLEPAWKALVSNKGLMPVLWQMFEGHPNLLPAFFEADIAEALAGRGAAATAVADAFGRAEGALIAGRVRKPLFSREGASVSIIENGQLTETAPRDDYAAHPQILQAYAPLPVFDGFRPVVGAWIIGDACAGIGMREDRSRITQDLSRFKPHFIRD
jgi:glutathionylspermidine synthase